MAFATMVIEQPTSSQVLVMEGLAEQLNSFYDSSIRNGMMSAFGVLRPPQLKLLLRKRRRFTPQPSEFFEPKA
jgi:hypothetical protein